MVRARSAVALSALILGCGGSQHINVSAASGGAVSYLDLVLTIPPGALAADTAITYEGRKPDATTPDADTIQGFVYTLGPEGTPFHPSATATITLQSPAPTGTHLVVSTRLAGEAAWTDLPSTASDTTAAAPLSRLGQIAARALDGTGKPVPTRSRIEHLIVVVQENHTFDDHFGRYCTAPTGSNPVCTDGPACCERGPDTEPAGNPPGILDDKANAAFTPNHEQDCEVDEIDGGKMDRFVTSAICGTLHNFAYADPAVVKPYWELAATAALADRYFQPLAGQSSANDMYFARANFVYKDNAFLPDSAGALCSYAGVDTKQYQDQTIGDLLASAQVPWVWYAEGYQAMLDAQAKKPRAQCPVAPADCPGAVNLYPCIYDPSDVPFEFYTRFRDNPLYMKDLDAFLASLTDGTLPSVSFVKGLGYHTEHPTAGDRLSDGVRFVSSIVSALAASSYSASTLLLVTYDEGGGYFDHVAPPPNSPVDSQPYGTRVPMLAVGPFARRNHVSHVTLEHSSVVKFIEWNWLGGPAGSETGQLHTRDEVVNNLGSLLDPAMTGTPVPE